MALADMAVLVSLPFFNTVSPRKNQPVEKVFAELHQELMSLRTLTAFSEFGNTSNKKK